MRRYDLRTLIFLALCCDLGVISKRLIAPFANPVTDALRIPGGIGTSFSLMFLVIAAELFPKAHCGAVMGFAQSMLALVMGQTGSMGALSPLGYILPGMVIDFVFPLVRRMPLEKSEQMMLVNAVAAAAAACTANAIVFRLQGAALPLYLLVACSTGSLCGGISAKIVERLRGAKLC